MIIFNENLDPSVEMLDFTVTGEPISDVSRFSLFIGA